MACSNPSDGTFSLKKSAAVQELSAGDNSFTPISTTERDAISRMLKAARLFIAHGVGYFDARSAIAGVEPST